MSSTASSSSSSVTPSQLIDKILKTKSDNPDFDLKRFVEQIDGLLAHYDDQLRKKNPIREKLGELPSASEVSNFADQVSTNVRLIAKEGIEGQRALLLEGVLSKVFDEEGPLLDAHQRPFHSSSLQPQNPLIFIIDSKYNYIYKWAALGKNLQQLQRNSEELQIIYVGSHFKSLTSKLAVRILAYTPDNSRTSTFYHKLSACFDTISAAVFRSTDQLEENSLKCLSAWEDISSYIWDRVAFLRNTPGESNFELLKELLVTEKTDYLLLSENRQVKVAALQGKLILLFVTYLDETTQVCTSAVKEMYLKMQESRKYVVEVVWVPIPSEDTSGEEFERAAANAPWPVVPNPWT